MEITVSAVQRSHEITLPMNQSYSLADKDNQHQKFGEIGLLVGSFRLQKCLNINPSSEIWLASDELENAVVVKISHHILEEDIYKRINEIECENLVPVLDYGKLNEYSYEVMPFYKNGSLGEVLDEGTIRKIVLPGIWNALNQLHAKRLIHNDIKPENLFWNDKKDMVLLGDYGCVSLSGKPPKGYSLSYVAPEILLGEKATPASDWASVGLTLGTLLVGEKIVQGSTKSTVSRWWERRFTFFSGSLTFNQLINGLIQKKNEKRQGSESVLAWLNDSGIGTEKRIRRREESHIKKQKLIFDNPRFIVDDIEGMLLAIENYWEHFVFLVEQRKVEMFLRCIKEEYYQYCIELKKAYKAEQTAFFLSYYFSGGEFFIWKGVKFVNLSDLEKTWNNQPDLVKEFLGNGSVYYILKNEGATEEELSYVKELMDLCRLDPTKACELLFLALQGDENFFWRGREYASIKDVVAIICSMNWKVVDEAVEELLNSSRFQSWMTFQGYGTLIDRVLKECGPNE